MRQERANPGGGGGKEGTKGRDVKKTLVWSATVHRGSGLREENKDEGGKKVL